MDHGQVEVCLHGLQKAGPTDTGLPAKSPKSDSLSPGRLSFPFRYLNSRGERFAMLFLSFCFVQ